jgi:hypothetical protein
MRIPSITVSSPCYHRVVPCRFPVYHGPPGNARLPVIVGRTRPSLRVGGNIVAVSGEGIHTSIPTRLSLWIKDYPVRNRSQTGPVRAATLKDLVLSPIFLSFLCFFALFSRLIKAKRHLNALIEGIRLFRNFCFETAPSITQEGVYERTKRIGGKRLVRDSYRD